jgi:hypothetical protein
MGEGENILIKLDGGNNDDHGRRNSQAISEQQNLGNDEDCN